MSNLHFDLAYEIEEENFDFESVKYINALPYCKKNLNF